MSPSNSPLAELLRSQLGQSVRWRRCSPTENSGLGRLLTKAAEHLSIDFDVIWTEDCPGEMFCLRGLAKPVVVFNKRYVEYWHYVRAAISDSRIPVSEKPAIIEQVCLQLMAEFALTEADSPEFSVATAIRAALGGSRLFCFPDPLQLPEPGNVASTFCWYFSLCHELGHLHETSLSKDDIAPVLDGVLHRLRNTLSEETLSSASDVARAPGSRSILSIDTLYSECNADVFATLFLLDFVREEGLLHKWTHGKEIPFRVDAFIAEVVISIHVILLIDRCRAWARIAATPLPYHESVFDSVLQPISLEVRLNVVLPFIRMVLDGNAENGDTSPVFSEIERLLAPDISAVDEGIRRAITYAQLREHRPNAINSIFELRAHMKDQDGVSPFAQFQLQNLCKFAASVGKWSPLFTDVLRTLSDPSDSDSFSISGEQKTNLYTCAWIKGKDGFNVPLILGSRFGSVVLVLSVSCKLFDDYLKWAEHLLKEGEEIHRAAIAAMDEHQLKNHLMRHLPVGLDFELVLEGTPRFSDCFNAILDGTFFDES